MATHKSKGLIIILTSEMSAKKIKHLKSGLIVIWIFCNSCFISCDFGHVILAW
jgi:hypothetical protein